MSDPIRIGLVGTGEIGRVHALAYARLEGVELALACGVRPASARALAAELGAPLYDSYDALLSDPAVAGVDVCVPNHLHREFAVRALEAGKHVLCEKPIALNIEDADAMLAAADRAKRFLMVAHVLRFWPEYVLATNAVAAGRIGEPLLVSGRRMVSLLAGTPGAAGWRRDPVRSGGAVLDMQIHDLDVFCWLLGQPESLVSRGVRSPDGAWNHVFTLVDFAGGRKAFAEASFMMQGNPLDIQFHILGTTGSLAWKYAPGAFALHGAHSAAETGGPSLVLYRWGKDPEGLYTPAEDSFAIAMRKQVAYFSDCVRSGTPPSVGTPRQARLALDMALTSATSCATGQPAAIAAGHV